jgi:hypothetical protein
MSVPTATEPLRETHRLREQQLMGKASLHPTYELIRKPPTGAPAGQFGAIVILIDIIN